MVTARESYLLGEDVRLRDIIQASVRHWAVLFLSVAVFTVLGLYMAYNADPVYRAEALLSPAESLDAVPAGGASVAVGGIASLVGLGSGGGGASNTQEALAVLRSRAFTTDFIEDNNLVPLLFPLAGESSVPTLGDAFDRMDRSVRRIVVDDATGLVRLEMYWTDPVLAAGWANGMVEALNERMRARAITEASDSLAFLQQELAAVSLVEMRQSLYGLIERQYRKRMLATVQMEFAFKLIDPAVPPELGKHVRPKRAFMVFSSLILGVTLGCILSFCLTALGQFRNQGKAA